MFANDYITTRDPKIVGKRSSFKQDMRSVFMEQWNKILACLSVDMAPKSR